MALRTTVVVAAVAAAIGVLGPGSASAAAGWQEQALPLPAGYEDGIFLVSTTDGKGGFAGEVSLTKNGTGVNDLVVWPRGGRPKVVPNPGTCTDVHPIDQNPAGLVVASARGCYGYDSDWTFSYDGTGFHRLAAVDYPHTYAVAVNPAGDVLGVGWTTDPINPEAALIWPHGKTTPRVVPITEPGMHPVDLDDDGTVLFQTGTGGTLWRGGTLTTLAIPAGFDHAHVQAIKRGIVVGWATLGEYDVPAAYWWPTPTTPRELPGGTAAVDINSSGLVVGGLMTWRDGKPAGALPVLGDTLLSSAVAVGDDGTVIGNDTPDYRSNNPVKWIATSRPSRGGTA